MLKNEYVFFFSAHELGSQAFGVFSLLELAEMNIVYLALLVLKGD